MRCQLNRQDRGKPMNRREFLQHVAGAAGVVVAGPSLVRAVGNQAGADGMPQPCPPTAWHKHGIVLEATEPWEGGQIQNFTSPAEPLDDGKWRIWYSPRGKGFAIAYAEGAPGEPFRKVPAVCTPGEPDDSEFAIGHLPDGWKPTQVVHVRLANGRHRIYFWAHGPEILRYLAAESDDGKRYKVVNPHRPVLWHPNDRAARGIPTPDGVVLTRTPGSRPAGEPEAPSRLISNDATMIYRLADGTFEMYSVGLVKLPAGDAGIVPEDNIPGYMRVVDRYVSEDGLHFEGRTRVIQRDERDPVDQQFYHLSVTYTPEGRVGMLGHYRAKAQTMDLEWCFSSDGINWHRPHRLPWLPRGSQTQPDSYGIYPPAGLVQHDGKWHLFYTGVNSAHNGRHSHGPARSVILYATTDSIWAS